MSSWIDWRRNHAEQVATSLLPHAASHPRAAPSQSRQFALKLPSMSFIRESPIAERRRDFRLSKPNRPRSNVRVSQTTAGVTAGSNGAFRGSAGSCRTVARWPGFSVVRRTIFPSGNSSASW